MPRGVYPRKKRLASSRRIVNASSKRIKRRVHKDIDVQAARRLIESGMQMCRLGLQSIDTAITYLRRFS